MLLPVTVPAVAIAALIGLWLAIRVGKLRASLKIMHGDDGGGPLTRRMRAQLNYVENTPFVLLLIAAIELSEKGGVWLAVVAAIYFVARILHAIGMEGEGPTIPRAIGVAVTMLTLLGLSVYAILSWFHVV